jgi:hypothetical protein
VAKDGGDACGRGRRVPGRPSLHEQDRSGALADVEGHHGNRGEDAGRTENVRRTDVAAAGAPDVDPAQAAGEHERKGHGAQKVTEGDGGDEHFSLPAESAATATTARTWGRGATAGFRRA